MLKHQGPIEATQVEQAKKQNGWLKKKSPSLVKSWQKRFFMILQNEEEKYVLAYYESDKDKKPKGILELESMTSIIGENERSMTIQYFDRNFVLKAKSTEIRDTWVKSIRLLKEYMNQKFNLKSQQQQQNGVHRGSITGQIPTSFARTNNRSMSLAIKNENNQENKNKNWKDIDQNSLRSLSIDKENLMSQISKDVNIEQQLNYEILKKTGIFNYFYNDIDVPKPLIENRIIYGFVSKRKNTKITQYTKRWMILISAKPIRINRGGEQDEEILKENILPPWMELDTLYYFHEDGSELNKKKKEDGIKMKDCLEITEKDMSKSKEDGFTFRINQGERIFIMMVEKENQRQDWIKCLRSSIKTSREINFGGVKKNIDPIINIYDNVDQLMERRAKLRQKIDDDFMKFKLNIFGENNDMAQDVKTLLRFCSEVTQDMLNIMKACLAKEVKRWDIIKEYGEYLHELVMDNIRSYWDKNYQTVSTIQYLEISKFLLTYNEEIKIFMEDKKVPEGVDILLEIYLDRMKENSENVIEEIINQEKKDGDRLQQLALEIDDILTSNAPVDVFKIINASFDNGLQICKFKCIADVHAKLAKSLIQHFQTISIQVLEEDEINNIYQLIVFCNNTIQYTELTNDLEDRLQNLGGLSEQEISKSFDGRELKQGFVQLSDRANQKILIQILYKLQEKFHKKVFLELDLENILEEFVRENQDKMTKQLHQRFARKNWKSILEQLVILYFQCFIISCQKQKKPTVEEYIDKMEKDKDYLDQSFQPFIFEQMRQKCLNPFQDMISFLTEDSGFIIQNHCRNLREVFGRTFSIKTVKSIYNIRKSMDKESKNEIIQFCDETIALYNKEHADEENIYDQYSAQIANQEEEQNDLNTESSTNLAEQNTLNNQSSQEQLQRKQTLSINLDDVKSNLRPNSQQDSNKTVNLEDQIQSEGYLLKKKVGNVTYEKRFFRIRQGMLYWYLTEKSVEPQNKITISEVEEIRFDEENKNNFILKMDKQKKSSKQVEYILKAESEIQANTWVKSLKIEQDKILKKEENLIQKFTASGSGKPLFKDFEAHSRREKKKQLIEKKKREEEEQKREQAKKTNQEQQNNNYKPQNKPQNKPGMLNFEINNDTSMETDRKRPLINQSQKKENNSYNNNQDISCIDKLLICLGVMTDPRKKSN